MLTKIKGAMLDPSAISDRLGYTPVNKAGDTLTGGLNLGNNSSVTGLDAVLTLKKSSVATGRLYLDYLNSSGNEIGYVGYGSSGHDKFDIANSLGDVQLVSNSIIGLVVDTGGRVKTTNQPAFNVYNAPNIGTNSNLLWTGIRYNTGNCYNSSTGKFTAPVAGRYLFTFNSLMQVNGDYVRLLFNINGTKSTAYGDTLCGGSTTNGWNVGWNYISIGMSTILQLSAGDWVAVWNDGPTSTYGGDYGAFSGCLLG